MAKMDMSFSSIRKIVPLVGIALLAYLVWRAGPGELAASFLAVNPLNILLAFLLLPPIFILQAAKWKRILDAQGIRLDYGYVLRVHLVSVFYGLVTPAKLGMFIRVPYLKKRTDKPYSSCASSVLLDKIFDLIVLGILSVAGSLLIVNYFTNLLIASIVVLALFLLLLYFLMSKGRSRMVLGILYRYLLPQKYKRKASQFFNEFYDSHPPARALLAPALLTFIVWLNIYTVSYVLALGFGAQIPYLVFITVVPIATLVGLIPVTIGGIGTREGTLIVLFSIYNIMPPVIISFSLTSYVIVGLVPALAGMALAGKEKI